MKSEAWRLIAAFITGCLWFSILSFCLHQPTKHSGEVKYSSKLIDVETTTQSIASSVPHRPSQDPAFNLKLNPNKKFIIIVAAFRSGSTFLGNLFDSNPTMQYLFEPFHNAHVRNLRRDKYLLGARPDHTESDLRMLYLQQMLHNCTIYPTPFPEKYAWCGSKEENLLRFNSTECGGRKLPGSHQEICRYRDTTVIKVIRLADLSDILKIAQIRSANVKIIQLLRHPVALMMSRRTGGKFFMWDIRTKLMNSKNEITERRTKMAWEAFNYCNNHLKAMELVESDPWLKDRYLRVTHHGMSLKPLEAAEKVYSFIGATLTDDIKDYIRDITEAKSEGFKNAPKEALNVYRNSTDIVTKWKKLVSATVKYWDVFSIEAQCKRMFKPLIDEFSVDTIPDLQLLKINSALDELYDQIEETDEPISITMINEFNG
ncbi:carbohydrate sulfotransferase 4-like [Bolinopsis microptera]|uniref:carbohydrate sulfotransferase 4-like n=1 Tax=Bolinopsis microptera TaxID=2820187 RepID=UPI00307A6B40